MNTSMISSTDSVPCVSISSKGKSAFTPVLQKPMAQRQSPINIFEASPVQKLLYLSVFAQQHQEGRQNVFPKMLASPMSKVTPSQYLRIGSFQDMNTPNLMRSESF